MSPWYCCITCQAYIIDIPFYSIDYSVLFNINTPSLSLHLYNPSKINHIDILAYNLPPKIETCHSISIERREACACMCLLSYVSQRFASLTKVLRPQERQPTDKRECHHVQEAFLLGLCLLRFGALESRLYDTTMARIEGSLQGACANRESVQP
jgi:hypothetical protein